MANVIKYIYTSVPENTVQAFPFVIGVNQGGYGSTAATGYWNGKTPNVGGYVVYVSVSPPSSPTIYVADNDTQLINLCNQMFGTGVSTVGAALQTFNGSTSTCCVNVDYSNIVTSGLVLNLDAEFTPSYPRTGTSWTDISGNANSGTLVNGPTYSSDGGGSLLFDGVDDCVTISTITLGNGNIPWTINAWIKTTTNANGLGQGSIISNSSSGPVYSMLGVNGGKIVYWTYQNSNWAQKLGNTTINDGNWHMLTWVNYSNYTMDMYVDGVLDASVANSTSGNNNPLDIIGSSWAARYSGRISNLLIYQNKSLTSQEVLQNYYAGLQRLIPKNNSYIWYDARNTNTQVITPTIANAMGSWGTFPGYPTNGTLLNGTSLNYRDGGISFSFDGTNDYIDTSTSFGISTYTICFWSKRELEDKMPIGTIIGTDFYWYGDNSWRYTHGGVGGEFYYPKPTSIPINTWGFYCVVYNGSNVSIYRQGVYQGQQSTTGAASFQGLRIGFWGGGAGYYYKGLISDVKFYLMALTAAEVSTIYTATKSRYGL